MTHRGRELEDRADIDGLLRDFYARVFGDPLLTRIFVDVAHMDLEEHLPVLGEHAGRSAAAIERNLPSASRTAVSCSS